MVVVDGRVCSSVLAFESVTTFAFTQRGVGNFPSPAWPGSFAAALDVLIWRALRAPQITSGRCTVCSRTSATGPMDGGAWEPPDRLFVLRVKPVHVPAIRSYGMSKPPKKTVTTVIETRFKSGVIQILYGKT